jgi:hypothetical protein
MPPPLTFRRWITPWLLGVIMPLGLRAAELSDADIAAIRTLSRQRCEDFFKKESGKPFVAEPIEKDWRDRGDFTRRYNQSVLLFATRAFHLQEQLDEANRALREMCQYHLDRPQTLLEIHSFPWSLSVLPRLCQLYGPDGARTKGLMSPDTHAVVLRTIWEWARAKSQLADAEVEESRTWYITNSENHHANHFTSCWAASLVLAQAPEYRDRHFDDGHSASAHASAWTAYLREYLRERGRKGMTIEVDSPSYAITTLSAVYRIHEMAEDPELRRRAEDYITLFWALWAEHQLDGVGGGAKTRTKPDHVRRGNDSLRRAAWYVLGFGDPEFVHASMLPLVTSTFELPAVVFDLARDQAGRGTYEIRQRRPGLAEPGYSQPNSYRMRFGPDGLLRYGYCTPEFIMGSFASTARPNADWAAISSQERWMGVVFRGDPDARVCPVAVNRKGGAVSNGFWAVQARGALIAQKLQTSRGADEWRVYLSKSGLAALVTEGRWLFTEAAGAFAAVHVVRGEFTFLKESTDRFGRWLQCADATSPVIIEVATKSDWPDLAAFRRALLDRTPTLDGEVLSYSALQGDRLTLFLDQRQPPQINGRPADLSPPRVYDSPFVQSTWDSGVVTVQKGSRRHVLDFNAER